MSKECPVCNKIYPDDTQFCEVDGTELQPDIQQEMPSIAGSNSSNISESAIDTKPEPLINADSSSSTLNIPISPNSDFRPATITLTLKTGEALTNNIFDLKSKSLIVGKFNSSTGPIDIDLSGIAGSEHVSRRHGEFIFNNGSWNIKDIGSTNGTFIKKAGESSFSPRIQEIIAIKDGDEVSFGNMVFVFKEN